MATAYLLLVHDHPARALRLVDRLWRTDDSFVVHVDRRAPSEVYAALFFGLGGKSNVLFTRRRVPVRRFAYSMVEATLECLVELQRSGRRYDHAVLLSGSHYPLRPPTEISRFFAGHRDRSFLWWEPMPAFKLHRIQSWHHYSELLDRWVHPRWPGGRLLPRRPPRGFAVYSGTQWFALSAAAVQQVLDTLVERPDVERYFRLSFCPDEMFFQTVLLNGPLRESLVRDDLVLAIWRGGDRPLVLTTDEWPELQRSEALFARKVEPETNALADRVDDEMLHRG
jgi:hypothetical protein